MTLPFVEPVSRPCRARGGGGAPCSAAPAPRFHSTLSTAVAVVAPCACDQQLDGVQRARRGSRPPRASRARAAPRRRSARRASGSKRRTPSSRRTCGTRLSANSVRRCEVVRGREAGQREVGGGDLGALEERDARAVVGRDVVPGRPARRASAPSASAEPVAVARTPGTSRRSARPARCRWRAKWPISTCPGSWPSVCATSSRVIARSSSRRPRPAGGAAPASTVRKPDSPAGLRSVGNQPEPKLIAFSCSENAARVLVAGALEVRRAAATRRAACARTARSRPRRCARCGARAATRAAPARMSSVRPTRRPTVSGRRRASVNGACPPTPPSTPSSRA